MYLAATSTHLASSVCGAGADGPGPPPSGPGAVPSAATSRYPSLAPNMIRPTVMSTLDYQTFAEHEPFLLAIPCPYSSTQTTYDHEQSQSALESIGQFGSEGNRSERSSKDTLYSQEIGDNIGPEMKVAGVSKFFKLIASFQPTTANYCSGG